NKKFEKVYVFICLCDNFAVKEVVEECLKCRCGIPQEILNRLQEESLKQKHETQVSQLQNIVQTFQELIEDQDIDSLLKECTQITVHCNHRSGQSLDNDEKSATDLITKQKRFFRIYAFVTQTDQPVISFSHDQQKCRLQKIGDNIFVGEFQVEQDSPISFQYNNAWNNVDDNCKMYLLRRPKETEKVPIAFETTVLKHLIENIIDWPSLKFALEAKNNLSSVIEKALPELSCNMLEGIKRELEKSAINLIPVYFITNLKKKNNNKNKNIHTLIEIKRYLNMSGNTASAVDKLLSPWHLFAIFQWLFQNKSDQNSYIACEMLKNDLKEDRFRHSSKLQLIFFLPCINYLSSFIEDNPLASSFSNKFRDSNTSDGKYDDLDKKFISILDTDFALRKTGNDAAEHLQRHNAERYVIQLLQHYPEESQS
ncbi:hypothetical protein RFI_28732, partial [Reticulomyxa filosa]